MDSIKGCYICIKTFKTIDGVNINEGSYWEYIGSDETFIYNLKSTIDEVIRVSAINLACKFMKLNNNDI